MVVAVVVRVGLGIVCVCVLGGCGEGGSMLPCTLKILPKSPKLPEVISHVLPYYYSLLLLPQIDKDNTILQVP